ncbi:MAG: T9SS type B sorting domain-containing protein [Aureispira sp.]|nr:T9SS type B sorting domain-containing protein [Aureispira sp.]
MQLTRHYWTILKTLVLLLSFFSIAPTAQALTNSTQQVVVPVYTDSVVTYCVDTNNVPGNVLSVFNICPGAANNGTVAPILLDGCVTYTAGTFVGTDTICVQVCDGGGICDTTILIFDIQSLVDTSTHIVALGQNTTICVDTTALPGNINSFTNLNCSSIQGTINSTGNACFDYTSPNTIGNDTICWAFCDDQGFCDTAVVILAVRSPIDTIVLQTSTDVSQTYCPDLSVFNGAVQSATNLNCSTLGQLTINNINSTTGCIDYTTGGVAGVDTVCLAICDNQGFCDTMVVVVNIHPKPDTIIIQVTAGGAPIDTCVFGSQLPGAITSYTDLVCVQDTLGTLNFNSTTGCINYTPPTTSTGLTTDTFCIQFCDSGVPVAYCDTAVFIIQIIPTTCVLDPLPPQYTEQVNDCNNIDLCIDVPFTSLSDYNLSLNGSTYNGSTSACKLVREITYDGSAAVNCTGTLSIQWVLNGITFGPQTVNGISGIVAQLNSWDGSTAWALSGTNIVLGNNNGNDQVSYGNLVINCSGQPSSSVPPTITQTSAKGTVLNFSSTGTYSLVVTENSTNCKDTTSIELYCIQSSTIRDTVVLGTSKQNCNIDLSQVPNVNTTVNNCAAAGTGNATFSISGNCITFTGNSEGSDLACIVVCSNTGVCDTTYVFIEVVPPIPTPQAYDDAITLQDGQSNAVVNVCDNDSIFTSSFSIALLSAPSSGNISQNDCEFTYTPDADFCGKDSFEYRLDNGAGVSTAIVIIERQCIDSLIVYDGFSPNGDGFNDFFVIKGLTQYPDHEILVFNRWGNRVLRATDYKNDWDGKFNGRDLPEGYYYYLINLNDGNGAILNGCTILRR